MNDDLCEELSIHPHQVREARARLAQARIADTARLFAVLGDPTRQRMLAALGDGELCVCDLALATGINRTTVSHQLRILREHHLVKSRRDGRVLFYSLDDDHVAHILSVASEHVAEQLVDDEIAVPV
ncbi:MAG: helix-turn-helix transcriptional regulator [Thermomicrobiales bacterium]|nr:helix-turn-helix transcriptional regulator [Thermomicrobiales bacterium]MCO5223326.1 metalloregulator ArsR/SmtB family transcription factor [Thermomicrobiales bacterium]